MAEESASALEYGRRRSSRRKLVGSAAAILGIATAGRAFAQDATPEPVSSPEAGDSQVLATPVSASGPLQYLFIQTSSQGAWSSVRGQPGAFFLTLTDPSPQTIVIQDEPANAAGTMSTGAFFDSIRIDPDDPLQAVISAQTSTGEDVLVVSLLRASYSPTLGELTYVASRLNDYTDQHGLVPLQEQTANFTLPPAFGATTVFITNAYCRGNDDSMCSFG